MPSAVSCLRWTLGTLATHATFSSALSRPDQAFPDSAARSPPSVPEEYATLVFQFLQKAILLVTSTLHVLCQLRPQKVQLLDLHLEVSTLLYQMCLMSASSSHRRRASRDTHAAFPSMSFARCWGSEAFLTFDLLIELFLHVLQVVSTSQLSKPTGSSPYHVSLPPELSSFLWSQTSLPYQQKDWTQHRSPQSRQQPCPRHSAAHSQSPSECSV